MDSQILLDAVAELVKEQTLDLERKLDAALKDAAKLRDDLTAITALFDEQAKHDSEATVAWKSALDEVKRQAPAAPAPDPRIDDLEARLDALPDHDEWERSLPDLDAFETGLLSKVDQRINEQVTVWARNLDARTTEQIGVVQELVGDEVGRLNVELAKARDLTTALEARVHEALEPMASKVDLQKISERSDSLESILDTLTTATAETSEAQVKAMDDLVESVADSHAQIEKAVAQVDQAPQETLRLLLGHYQGVEDWKRGGAGYKALSVVRHLGALWQAPQDTLREPGAGDDWALLADGVSGVQVECDDAGRFQLEIKMASGASTSAGYQLPHINFRGVYDENTTYARYDAMVKDGHTFLALVDGPGEVGVNKGEWMTIGYRGKAGKRGPSLDEVVQNIKVPVVKSLSEELPGLVAVAVEARE